jgi:phage-related protein
VLKVVSQLIGAIATIIGEVLSGIGAIISATTDAIGLTDGTKSAAYQRAGSRISGAAETAITVNATILPIDANEASSKVAEKIKPHILEAKQQHEKQLKDVAHRQNVNAALRGGR